MTLDNRHDRALHWFVQLSDADAPETAWVEFQAWLEADPAHAEAYDRIEQTWVALDEPADVEPAVLAVAANETAPRVRRRTGAMRALMAPVAALAAACLLTLGLWPEISGQGRFRTYAAAESPREVVLPDGSRIALNRRTELRVRIGSRDRAATLAEGEAAFDIRHDADRPFVISADDHQVRVLGTAFNVLNHADRFSVGVTRGRVAVSGPGIARTVSLDAGQKVEQTGANAAIVSAVEAAGASSWREGVLVYRDAALGDVADDLSRYLDKPVKVATSARALRFTGALRIGDEATMLRQLQDFVPIRVSRARDQVQLTALDAA